VVQCIKDELEDMKYPTRAIFVLRKPTDRAAFLHHWCIKIFFGHGVLFLDFGERGGQGYFGYYAEGASEAVMSDLFLYSSVNLKDPKKKAIRRYEIIARVLPPAFEAAMTTYLKRNPHRAQELEEKLGFHLWKWTKKYPKYEPPQLKTIDAIGKMLEEYASNTKRYCSLLNNCQRFIFEVFSYLAIEHHKPRVEQLALHLQSPNDKLDMQKRFGHVAEEADEEAPQRQVQVQDQPKEKEKRKGST
jgi:hypothetical protein